MSISSIVLSPVVTDTGVGMRGSAPVAPVVLNAADKPAVVAGVDVAAPAPSSERIAQAIKQVNDAFVQNGQNLYASFEKDKATGINVIKILDKNTEEEVRQYPSKAIIAIAESLSQSNEGKVHLMNISA